MPAKRGLPATAKMRHDRHYVEELYSHSGAPVGRMIAIDRLEPNPQQPRIDMGDLEELISSVKDKGVLEPILVRPSEVGGRYMIISGERRYRASLEAGLREVPCIEMKVDDRTVAEIALIENLQRKDLNPYEEADGLLTLKERFGYTDKEVAQKIGKSRSTVTEALALAAMPIDIRDRCRQADITSKSMLLQVARQEDKDAMLDLVGKIARSGMKRDEVRKVTKNKQEHSQPFVYRYAPPHKEYNVEVKFRKSNVTNDELLIALENVAEDVRRNS